MPGSRVVAAGWVAAILAVAGVAALGGDALLTASVVRPTAGALAGVSPSSGPTTGGPAPTTPAPSPTTPGVGTTPDSTPGPTLGATPGLTPTAAASAVPTGVASPPGTRGGGSGTARASTAPATVPPPPPPPPPPAGPRTVTTTFGADENPLSQGGLWINGGTTGLSWTNVRSVGGMAVGTQTGAHGGTAQQYDDSTAVLAGAWGPNQMAQARVRILAVDTGAYEEVELRLRTTITPRSITGYEVDISDRPAGGDPYVSVVRWNGPLGSFTVLGPVVPGPGPVVPGPGLKDGDLVKATMVGSTIRVFINGSQVLQVSDGTYTSGSPGMGFFLQAPSGTNANYGFTEFWAQDGL